MRSFGIVAALALVDHLLEEHLIRELHQRPERGDVDAVAAREAQHREQAHERRDEAARIAVRVDHLGVGVLGEHLRQRLEVAG